jgi:hypothetical protein
MNRPIFLFFISLSWLLPNVPRSVADTAQIADRTGLESVWKRSGRTTRVIDYPYSPQPGKYGGEDTREWGNQGYIFSNPETDEFEGAAPLPAEKIAPPAVTELDELLKQLEEEKVRRKKLEADLEKLRGELQALADKAADETIKRKELELQLEEMDQKGILRKDQPIGPGGELVIEKTETYRVGEGENLWKIAGKPEVYNDPYKWLLLYHANRDQIFDPDLIYPGMILLVPRYRGMEFSPAPPSAGGEETSEEAKE